MAVRLRLQYEVSVEDAMWLTSRRSDAMYFEGLLDVLASDSGKKANDVAPLAISWLRGEFARVANEEGVAVSEFGISAAWLSKLLRKRAGGGWGRKAKLGVVSTGCLKVCPRHAVTVVNGARPRDWMIVQAGTPIEQVEARLGLGETMAIAAE